MESLRLFEIPLPLNVLLLENLTCRKKGEIQCYASAEEQIIYLELLNLVNRALCSASPLNTARSAIEKDRHHLTLQKYIQKERSNIGTILWNLNPSSNLMDEISFNWTSWTVFRGQLEETYNCAAGNAACRLYHIPSCIGIGVYMIWNTLGFPETRSE